MDDMKRYYEILELEPGASPEEVKRAYRDLAKVWHPDRFSHDPPLQQKAQEKLKEINRAYERLSSYRPDPHFSSSQQESWSRQSQSWSQSSSYQSDRSWTYQKPKRGDDFERSRFFRVFVWIITGLVVFGISKLLNVSDGKEKTTPKAKVPAVKRYLKEKYTQPPIKKDKVRTAIPGDKLTEKQRVAEVEPPPPADKPSNQKKTAPPLIAADHFTLGSSKDDVLAIQGEPDQALTKQFRYGTSYVYFSRGRVTGWNSESPPLKVKLKSFYPTSKTQFAIGSTMDEVIDIQGTPDYYSESRFRYGTSYVYFSNRSVTGWRDGIPPLKAKK